MAVRKKTKSAKAKAGVKSKRKAKTKSSAAAVRRTKSPSRKTKPKTKTKPKAPPTTPSKPALLMPQTATPAPSNPQASAPSGFQVEGTNNNALFTLKLHRGEGMTLVAMNWKNGPPPRDFVGFAIAYQEPGGSQFYALNNRLGFLDAAGNVNPAALSTLQSPIQKFRWVHFP